MDGGGTAGIPGIPGLAGLVELGRTPAAVTYRATDARRSAASSSRCCSATRRPRCAPGSTTTRRASPSCVEHPDIVDNLAHGYTAGNQPYIVMEELSGGSMADRVGSGMDGPGVLAIGIKIAGALESAHRRNLIHGDLRPDDILVTDDGEPHIADLGVALVTGLGPDRSTTPERIAHAAPEQLERTPDGGGRHLRPRLGPVLAARRHAGVRAARRHRRDGRRHPHRQRPAPDLRPTGRPEAVIDVIERAMAKNPAERWESAEAMGHALQQARGHPRAADHPDERRRRRPEPGPVLWWRTPRARLVPGRSPPGARSGGPGWRPARGPGPEPAGGSEEGPADRARSSRSLAIVGGAVVVLGGGDDGDDEQTTASTRTRKTRRTTTTITTTDRGDVARRPTVGAASPDATGTIDVARVAGGSGRTGRRIAPRRRGPPRTLPRHLRRVRRRAAPMSRHRGHGRHRRSAAEASASDAGDARRRARRPAGRVRRRLRAPPAGAAGGRGGGLRRSAASASTTATATAIEVFAGVDADGRSSWSRCTSSTQDDADAVDAVYASIDIA